MQDIKITIDLPNENHVKRGSNKKGYLYNKQVIICMGEDEKKFLQRAAGTLRLSLSSLLRESALQVAHKVVDTNLVDHGLRVVHVSEPHIKRNTHKVVVGYYFFITYSTGWKTRSKYYASEELAKEAAEDLINET